MRSPARVRDSGVDPMWSHPLLLAIVATLILGVGKLVAALATGSQAVLASGLDSLTDAAVSALNLWTVRHAARPADRGHPYGHGKAEALASLAQGGILTAIVLGVGYAAVGRLVSGTSGAITVGPAMIVMVLSMGGSLAISSGLARAAARTGSLILRSDAVHYRMDLWTGAAVLAGLVGTALTGSPRADAVASLLVAGLMARDVFGLVREAVGELMDQPLPPEERARVEAALGSFSARLRGWHDLRTRRAGPSRFVQVRLVLPGHLSLTEAHALAHEVEAALGEALPGAEILVHVDAEGSG